jgi:hypothetical protein
LAFDYEASAIVNLRTMPDDPRIKRVLKRYPKGQQFSDASIEVTNLGFDDLLQACRCNADDALTAPRELDDHALAHFARRMGIEFDSAHFDYFLHSYVRSEFVSAYFADPSISKRLPPEDGPPRNIPLAKGRRWFAVRPRNGKEHFEAYEVNEPNEQT